MKLSDIDQAQKLANDLEDARQFSELLVDYSGGVSIEKGSYKTLVEAEDLKRIVDSYKLGLIEKLKQLGIEANE